MTQTVIIADDLSGAADCASAFVKAGLEALVIIDRQAAQGAELEAAQVVSIDADTRRLPAAEAAEIHRELCARYRTPGQLLYKKIDSTLRGNFAQELAAIIDQAGLAIVAPAFPQAGRFTRNGHQYLNDAPLEETEIWRGEGIAGTAHIPGMLARHGIKAASLGLDEIRQGAQHVRARLETCARDGVQAVVCDVAADADLRTIAQASLPMTVPRFWVGSAGLANHLPAAAHASGKPAQAVPVIADGSILTVVGSLSSVSRAQAECLFAGGGIERVEVATGILRQGQSHPQWQQIQRTLEALLRKKCDVLILIGREEPVNMGEGLQLCQALAQLVAPLAAHIGAVISTGGETARAILSAMGSTGLRLAGEVEPGVPLSVAAGIRPIPVITKAGAFGSRDTLLRCHETLRQARAGAGSTSSHRKAS
ncbi:four-carbon acid sugar kinase family protein [Noviherbaspirillum sp. UKPF54]|uniref:four-carbon acid sugar kinase family protein n=1 Tax=Noviherbaspirillum sp. UKPF54 TaxID=2601898 RepID=UPI0011B1A9C8|nr:four-carbon acid sugar kinase family protein [Noviherbaspirillum sp. UKPF54]QDZ29689.1 four-carbon acid sugar kinase family protein [Noviherbaspirillum sp. UKPF54]